MWNWIVAILSDPNTRWILLGCLLLGFSSGIIGSFTFLRKQSLMGDTLAHAALPGICIAFMLTETKSVGLFLFGALVAGIVATFGISWITLLSTGFYETEQQPLAGNAANIGSSQCEGSGCCVSQKAGA